MMIFPVGPWGISSRCDKISSGTDVLRCNMENRITIDPKICQGQACIKGTRIPVHQILRMLSNGDTEEDLIREFPSLTREDILACFDYAASLAEEQVTPLEVSAGDK